MAKETKRVLVVSEHSAFREALAVVLNREQDLEVAWQAGSVADTRDVHLDGIDVALIDPLLPDGDGLVLLEELSATNPTALALVLSHRIDADRHHQALVAGTVEVLTTDASVEEVIAAVRRVGERRHGAPIDTTSTLHSHAHANNT